MTTLKEVAALAGVSAATVSKVLSNTPYVSEATRALVLKAVADLGYTPNLAARALASGRTYNVGVIFPLIYTSLFSDAQTIAILEGVEAASSARGYNILISTPTVPVEESVPYQRLIRSRYLDGFLLLENLPTGRMSDFIAAQGYPCVAIGYHSPDDNTNVVRIDDYGGAHAAAAHLAALGHRHIGIINAGQDTTFYYIDERIRGYRDALSAAGIDFGRLPMAYGAFSIASGATAMASLLAQGDSPPTAVLCVSDLMALGAMQTIRSAGLRIPDDISIVGFDDIPMAAYFDPPLTTVRQPSREIGAGAAQMLFDLLEKKQDAVEAVLMPTSLVVRGSSGRVNQSEQEVNHQN